LKNATFFIFCIGKMIYAADSFRLTHLEAPSRFTVWPPLRSGVLAGKNAGFNKVVK
jgi:hypothetical protein